MTESQILVFLLTATEAQLHTVRNFIVERNITDLKSTNMEDIQFLPGLEHLDFDPPAFADFKLSRRPQRTAEMTELLRNLTEPRSQWLQAVHNTNWHKDDWGAAAFHLRSWSYLEKVGRAETYALLATSMHLQQFARPAKLAAVLWNHDRDIADNAIQTE
jgi:hypothetical protein